MACTGLSASARYVMKRIGLKQSPCGTPMLVSISFSIFVHTFTWSVTFPTKSLIMCSSSSSRTSFRISNGSLFLTVSKALNMSNSRSVIYKSLDVVAFSASTSKLQIISVVLLPCWYAACVSGTFFNILCRHLLSMHIARIFSSADSNMIGLKCSGVPALLPGFGIGTKIPFFISSANFPVSAISLYMSEISLLISFGPHFSSSA